MLAPAVAACESCTHLAVIETRPMQPCPLVALREQFCVVGSSNPVRPGRVKPGVNPPPKLDHSPTEPDNPWHTPSYVVDCRNCRRLDRRRRVVRGLDWPRNQPHRPRRISRRTAASRKA